MSKLHTLVLPGFLALTLVAGLSAAPPARARESTVDVSAVDSGAAARKLLRRIAGKDPRADVRADAWVAWAQDDDEVTAEFLDTGLAAAEQRAAETGARNLDFCNRILATYTAKYAPEVHAAAQRAVSGTDADRDLFVRREFAAAEQRDRVTRAADGTQERAIAEEDRQYVRTLAVHDPGPQVRIAAAWAIRAGATDADLVEFFAYGWGNAAELDLEARRLLDADQEARWQSAIRRLLADAQAAEQAALDAAGEIAVQLRAAAARAWKDVGENTGPARTAWSQAQEVALGQAANWRSVAAAASAATGPNWHAIAGTADQTATDWAAERDWAAQQAGYWQDLLTQAVDGETRMH